MRTASFALLLTALIGSAARASAPLRVEWSIIPAPPQPTNGRPSMLDDAPRHRVLLFGGEAFGTTLATIWSRPVDGSSRWRPLPSTGAPPELSWWAIAVLDASRDRIFIWDGALSTLWTVRLGRTLEWSSHRVAGGPISGEAIAFDESRRRLVSFGGGDISSGGTDQVWALPIDTDGDWIRLDTHGVGPTGRKAAIAVVDGPNDRLLVHGGSDFTYTVPHIVRGDLWQLSLSTLKWTPLYTADDRSDLCYSGHAGVIDEARRRLLFFGGSTGDYYASTHAEVRAYSLDGPGVWSIAALPDPERGGVGGGVAAAYDAASEAVIEYQLLFRGPAHSTHRLNLANATWTALESLSVRPEARFGQATAFDPVRREWVSFGGRRSYYDGNENTFTYDDLWTMRLLDRPEWKQMEAPAVAPPARQDARMVYDPGGDRMVLFGGQVTTGVDRPFPGRPGYGTPHFYGDTWVLTNADPPVWSPVASPGPSPRDGHLMVYDSRRSRILLFGGRDSIGGLNDLWEFSLGPRPRWRPLATEGPAPSARWQSVGAYDRVHDRLVVSGGSNGASLGDTWQLDLGARLLSWKPYPTIGVAPPVGSATRSFVFDEQRRRLLVFGDARVDAIVPEDALPAWSLTLGPSAVWDSLPIPVAPRTRYGMGVALDPADDLIMLTGGTNTPRGDQGYWEPWILDLDAWRSERVPLRSNLGSTEASPAVASVPPMISLEGPSPNPAARGASIGFVSPREDVAALDVFDVAGRRRESHVLKVQAGRSEITIGAGLEPGLYLVRLELSGEMRWRRLIIVR